MSAEKNTKQAQPAMLDVDSVASLLNCPARHVYRLADSGRMPRPIRLGSLVRWNRAELDDWIARGCPAESPKTKGGSRS